MDDVAILATPFELQEVQIPMCVVYFYIYMYELTVIPDLVWEGRGLRLKLQLPKNLITTWLKKSIVILFHIRNEVRIQFQMF